MHVKHRYACTAVPQQEGQGDHKLTCSPCVLVTLKYCPFLSSTALPLPPGTVSRSLTGFKSLGMVKSLLAFSGAEIAAAAVTLTRHTDRTACLRPARRQSDRDEAITGLLAAHRTAWLRAERFLVCSRMLCKRVHPHLRALHSADSVLEARLWHDPIPCSCWSPRPSWRGASDTLRA